MRKPSTSNNPTPDFLKVSCQKYGDQDFLTLLDGLLLRMRKVGNAILPRSLNHNDTKTTAGVWLDWHIRFKQGRILLHKKWVHSRYFCLCKHCYGFNNLQWSSKNIYIRHFHLIWVASKWWAYIACNWDVRFSIYVLGTVCCQHINQSRIWRWVLSVICVQNEYNSQYRTQPENKKAFEYIFKPDSLRLFESEIIHPDDSSYRPKVTAKEIFSLKMPKLKRWFSLILSDLPQFALLTQTTK